MERGVQGSRTWTRIVDIFRVHCEYGGRGTLSVDSGEDGARRINLSLNLQDGFIQRRVKPPGRHRRDQLRREAWLKRREAWCREERTPPGSNVSGAPDQENRPVSTHTTYTPGATDGGEGGQSGTRLDTNMEDNSWAAKIIRTPGGTSLTELGPAPAADRGEHNVNEDATAPTPGQPCEMPDDEMPNGNIPQLDGEDDDLSDIIDLSKHAYNAMIDLSFQGSYKVHSMKIYELKGLKSCEGEVKGLDHKCNICAQNRPIFKPIPGTEMNFYVTDMHDGLRYRVVDHDKVFYS